MNEVWKLTLENDGKTASISGKTISELMQYLTEEGLTIIQIAHDEREKEENQKESVFK